MPQSVIIKCPYCSVQLKIKKYPDNPDKAFITCPTCKHRSLFKDFATVNVDEQRYSVGDENANEDVTQVGIRKPEVYTDSDKTTVNIPKRKRGTIGTLTLPNEEVVQLHVGINTIGRRAQGSLSEIQFPDFDDTKKSSRHHARIEVVAQTNGQYTHILSNWENKNPTLVNDIPLEPEATAVLHDGDTIWCADVCLHFSIKEQE